MKWTEMHLPTIGWATNGRWRLWLWPVPFLGRVNWCVCILRRERVKQTSPACEQTGVDNEHNKP